MKLVAKLIVLLFVAIAAVSAHGSGHKEASEQTGADDVSSSDSNEDSAFGLKVGFILVTLGGLVPVLGASLLYVEDLIKLIPGVSPTFTITNNQTFLASVMSFSIGVLLCTIFLALIPEAFEGFETSKLLEPVGSDKLRLVIGCAVFAIFVIATIAKRVLWKSGHDHGHHHHPPANTSISRVSYRNASEKELIEEEVGDISTMSVRDEATNFRSVANKLMIAFFIHNIPEGLVTFMTAFESYKTGIMFTIALSLHKFPEGIMIAAPIYYGYRSKWKAIVGVLVSTLIPQLIGALLGWASTKISYDSIITGVMFLVATTILSETTMNEVIPMARQYDPNDKCMTNWVLIGMSLFLFLKFLVE
ncbi:Zip-domain-containing protein [Conidiobolus coronatus NRRL 28638]|uniref:Zip-domain-containing protein n=1 Tax=Conidiobolus coronatus (strain ATCC 28846 / CBS 209.66 / NRRL 28638) TaxID=796925 RepID=A0A137PF30_CONC2|nr:Zip-domain-containing protein [Conidiobolus coronatus NRRL 28638]|eukprot:KXN73614.1 Zip-domain-containing protein [Conidiobolus coronatus NRRL 28638]